jgi:ornithine carbamoyltransferase
LCLVDLGERLRLEKRMGERLHRLAGRNIALIFEKASTRSRAAFEVAAHDEGAHVTGLHRVRPGGEPAAHDQGGHGRHGR